MIKALLRTTVRSYSLLPDNCKILQFFHSSDSFLWQLSMACWQLGHWQLSSLTVVRPHWQLLTDCCLLTTKGHLTTILFLDGWKSHYPLKNTVLSLLKRRYLFALIDFWELSFIYTSYFIINWANCESWCLLIIRLNRPNCKYSLKGSQSGSPNKSENSLSLYRTLVRSLAMPVTNSNSLTPSSTLWRLVDLMAVNDANCLLMS